MGNPGWIIDRDLLGAWDAQPNGDVASDAGTVGPGSFTGDPASLDIPFRLYDDDGELYYEGRMNADAMDAYGEGLGQPPGRLRHAERGMHGTAVPRGRGVGDAVSERDVEIRRASAMSSPIRKAQLSVEGSDTEIDSAYEAIVAAFPGTVVEIREKEFPWHWKAWVHDPVAGALFPEQYNPYTVRCGA